MKSLSLVFTQFFSVGSLSCLTAQRAGVQDLHPTLLPFQGE